ncbi:hypothetical protein NEHOM01_0235 [Nematocida homosporus]|uniref:uncharacterized protein n=1 Tax=Nematocida homosporus TaxID=1912981 RepID=UPI00221F2905|nr:uncharacterized protein NEHOM01_0235 [Nematocida homosporus]KAI5184560.1 hypothetical protein NEHOM01_0235 [Nematocida homosporus]
MKSHEENIFGGNNGHLKHNLEHKLAQNHIEEIILKSIEDQETLFNQTLLHTEEVKDDYNNVYAREIIDMCSGYNIEESQYGLSAMDAHVFAKKTVPRPHDKPFFQYKSEKKKDDVDARPFICTYANCFKAFKRFEHLKRHYRIHTGERPFRCPVYGCNKMFSRSDNLMQHSKIHANRKMQ